MVVVLVGMMIMMVVAVVGMVVVLVGMMIMMVVAVVGMVVVLVGMMIMMVVAVVMGHDLQFAKAGLNYLISLRPAKDVTRYISEIFMSVVL